MRITQNMIVRNSLYYVSHNRDEMNRSQERIVTQKKILRPSDDSYGYTKAMRFRRQLERNEQYLANIQMADAWMTETSYALNQMYTYAQRAYEYAQRAADGSTNQEIRQDLADMVRSVQQEIVSLSNMQHMGKSLFAGSATNTVNPFTLENDQVTYSGNNEQMKRRISRNMDVVINVTGQQIMDSNIFTALSNLIQAMENDDDQGILDSMEQLKHARENLLSLSSSKANEKVNLDMAQSRLEESNLNLERFISEIEDTPLEEEIVFLKAQENAYMGALKVTSEIMGMNILNYLK